MSEVTEIIKVVFVILGAAFLLVASIGVLRMPDLFTRMSASAKAGTLGVGFMLAATALHFEQAHVTTRAILILLFFVITAPVAAHMIARAGYLMGAPLWTGTLQDEMRGRFDPAIRKFQSPKEWDEDQERKKSGQATQSPRSGD